MTPFVLDITDPAQILRIPLASWGYLRGYRFPPIPCWTGDHPIPFYMIDILLYVIAFPEIADDQSDRQQTQQAFFYI